MNRLVLAFLLSFSFFIAKAQSGYEVTINLKNYSDSLAYLTFYQFDKTYIKDTCRTIKNGKIIFKGKTKLDKGIYSIVGQQKNLLFDFFIENDNQILEINSSADANMVSNLEAKNAPILNDFFGYIKYINEQSKKFDGIKQKAKGKSKTDSIAFITKERELLDKNFKDYENQVWEKNKNNLLGTVLNLKIDKLLKDIPKASNGRPDSVAVFKYYKKHYWDNVNLKEDAIVKNPFFYKKLKTYFDDVVLKNPDSVAVEIDKMIVQTVPGSLVNKLLISYFTYSYESSKIVGFDKVFVHMADTYFKTGKANDVYDDPTAVDKIIKKANRLRPLLIGAKAPELFMIKASDQPKMKQIGIEAATTSEEVTRLYYANQEVINKLFFKLNEVTTDYTILVFWDVDCSHCVVEIPKLLEVYHDLKKEKKPIEIISFYTQFEGDKWLKYIDEKKLDWINVYDGAHFNNVPEKYDVYSTPIIYILDKNKIIKGKKLGVDQIKEFINILEKSKL